MEKETLTSHDLISIGELAASVGIEINNPLMSIISCAQTLFDESSEEITINNHPYVKTTFCDSGVSRDKAIDQLFVSKSRRSVTGAVLDDNYRIIEYHGGKLITDSKEGEFIKVCVVLPIIS